MTKTKEEKEREAGPSERERCLTRTRNCALTNAVLDAVQPVVADELGCMFNKEGVLTALVEKSLPPEFSHIRGLRDCVDCYFCPNPAPRPELGDEVDWTLDTWAPFTCPIAGLEMNGRHQFVVLRRAPGPTADTRVNVISEKALREVRPLPNKNWHH